MILPWRKILISIAISAHLLAISAQNVPASRSLRALYDWYIGLSGQLQGWTMFSKTGAQGTRIELFARRGNEAATQPFGPSRQWPGNVLDVVTDAFASEATAQAFFGALRATYPAQSRPDYFRLQLLHKPIAELGAKPGAMSTDYVASKEFSRKW